MKDLTIFVNFLEENGIDIEVNRDDKTYTVIYCTDRYHRMDFIVERLTPDAIKNFLKDEFDIIGMTELIAEVEIIEMDELIENHGDLTIIRADLEKWRKDLIEMMDEYIVICNEKPIVQEPIFIVYKTDVLQEEEMQVVYIGTMSYSRLIDEIADIYDLSQNQKNVLTISSEVCLDARFRLRIEKEKTNCYIG